MDWDVKWSARKSQKAARYKQRFCNESVRMVNGVTVVDYWRQPFAPTNLIPPYELLGNYLLK